MSKAKKPSNKSAIRNKNKTPVANQKMPRNREKYPALNFRRQVKTRLDQLDCDYVDQLNDAEKDFLNRFLEETVIANFKHKGKKIYKDAKPFYNANNERNRCIYTAAKARGTLKNISAKEMAELLDQEPGTANDIEDAMLARITLKRAGKLDDT